MNEVSTEIAVHIWALLMVALSIGITYECIKNKDEIPELKRSWIGFAILSWAITAVPLTFVLLYYI